MNTRLNGTSLFTGINSGLTNTFAQLAELNPDGVTLESISAARSNTNTNASVNQSFAQYMQTNFSSLDKDGDGIIGSTEMTDMTNNLSTQGLTQAQLMQLGVSSGLSTATLEKVLQHFNEIDTNKDGKVTTSEISAYGVDSEVDKKKAEFANRAATNMSTFYGDEGSSVADSSSMLDYKYLDAENA